MKTLTSLPLLALLFLAACAPPKSATVSAQENLVQQEVQIPQYASIPAQQFSWVTEDGGQSQLDFNPKIDILFVMDNSDSMRSAQENLARNIFKFTGSLMQNRMIDYHIGVVSCWDSSERYIKTKKDPYQIGDLRYIKDSTGKSYNQRFLTRAIRSQNMLASSINIGVTPYDQGGPEKEEFFSPLSAALEKTGHGDVNEGFFRDDAQLVVIVMTDADDSSARITPEQMAQTLSDFKPGHPDKISVYGVLVRAQDPDQYKDWDLRVHPKYHPECFDMTKKEPKNNGTCSGFGPERLEEFIIKANSNAGAGTPDQIRKKFFMSIISKDFGQDLSTIGGDITVKTLAKNIYLQQRPRFDESSKQIMVRVRYGSPEQLAAGRGQLIPQGENGWLYNPDDNSIRLSGSIKYSYVDGARFAVDLVPLTLKQ